MKSRMIFMIIDNEMGEKQLNSKNIKICGVNID